MADTTPNLGLNLPTIGANRDTWGALLNANTTTLDTYVSQACPIGLLADFAGPQAPPGYLICDGRLVSRTTYSALFAVIGVAWGAGDGSTTFALPNLNGRTAVGAGSITDPNGTVLSLSFAQSLGELSTHILQAHMPNYTITTNPVAAHAHSGVTAPGGNHTHGTDAQGGHTHGGTAGAGTGMGINDPWHSHTTYHYFVGGSGAIASGAGYTNVLQTSTSYTAPTGITLADPGHVHGIAFDGNHAHNISYSGNLQLGIYADGAHSHTMTLGGTGALLSLMQPTVVITKIIYAGQQAVTAAVATLAPVQIEGRDEVAELRGELEQLRAQIAAVFGTPQRRVMSAPLRGPH
jgi:microcystin-dependent protein